jgi:hypothetical protein
VVIARGKTQRRGRSRFDFMGTVIAANLTWLSRTAPRRPLRIAALRWRRLAGR